MPSPKAHQVVRCRWPAVLLAVIASVFECSNCGASKHVTHAGTIGDCELERPNCAAVSPRERSVVVDVLKIHVSAEVTGWQPHLGVVAPVMRRPLTFAQVTLTNLGGGRKGYSRLRRWEAVGSISLELPPNVRKSESEVVRFHQILSHQILNRRKAFKFRLRHPYTRGVGGASSSSQYHRSREAVALAAVSRSGRRHRQLANL